MAARDPVLDELMRNGGAGRASGEREQASSAKRDHLEATSSVSTTSFEVKSEDIGKLPPSLLSPLAKEPSAS